MPAVPVPLGSRAYAVHLRPLADAPGLLADAGLRIGPCLVVTDANVGAHYLDGLVRALEAAGWAPRAIALPPGEETKSLAHLGAIYDWALGEPIDRRTPVLALGGGVVGDLAGFAAATLLRGLPLVQIPTSLVAQVDSAVGGKTGINHGAGKNLLGAFHQPRLVLADPSTLRTLPAREWTSGLAEVVKAALIADAGFFEWLDVRWEAVIRREPDATTEVVRRAVAVKAAIVAEDEYEAGRRALLNFGHTFGHALEKAARYGTFTHGEAVALGMRAALHLSHALRPSFDPARADALVARIPIPPGLSEIPTDTLVSAMAADKKREGDRLRFVVLESIGAAAVRADVTARQVWAAWEHAKNASTPR